MATVLEQLGTERLRPLRREEYDRLVAQGWFEGERIELLGGLLVEMSPTNTPHTFAVQELDELLRPVGARAKIRVQMPFALSDDSEPEPDLVVAPRKDYADAHPSEALLLIEVADSSLARDRGVKLQAYARAAVPEYWIVNLVDHVVELYSDPGADGYASVRHVGLDGQVAPLAFPDVVIPVRAFLR